MLQWVAYALFIIVGAFAMYLRVGVIVFISHKKKEMETKCAMVTSWRLKSFLFCVTALDILTSVSFSLMFILH